jgi:anti-sigma regulatory factor (Ser/Thr protein kinase)
VPAHQFYFSLELSSQGVEASLVEDLAAQVLEHVGCSREDIPELAGALEQAVARNAFGERRCDVQFRAHNGRLEILVSSNGGRIFQTSRTI